MPSLFISYSRKDIESARKLTEAFKSQDLDFWIDWEGIPPTVDWWKEIEKGIEEADIFLFLLSPDSAKSSVCRREIEHAVKNGKRLVPVVVRDVKADESPQELRHLNWIFLRETDDFEPAFSKLIAAVKTDYAWVQAHKQLQVKALEWERSSSETSFLLRGKELQDAELQLVANASKEPHPTDLQREYVLRSRQESDRQRRRTRVIAVGVIIALAVLAIFGFVQARLATANAVKEQAASTLAVSNANTAEAASTLAFANAGTAQANAEEARSQTRVALSRQLASQAIEQLDDHYDLALLLGVQSRVSADTVEAQSSLLRTLQYNRLLKAFLRGHSSAVTDVAFRPDGAILASADRNGQIVLWDLSDTTTPGPLSSSLPEPGSSIGDLSFSPDGRLLVYNDSNGNIILLDVSKPDVPTLAGAPVTGYESHALRFASDGRSLVSASLSGTISVWNVSNPEQLILQSQASLNYEGAFSTLSFSSDGMLLASGDDLGRIALWDVSEPQKPVPYAAAFQGTTVANDTTMGVQRLAFSPDNQTLASADFADKIILWDVSKPGPPHQLSAPFSDAYLVPMMAFSPDGRILAVSNCDRFDTTNLDCVDGQVVLWDVSNTEKPFALGNPLTVDRDQVLCVAFSPDRKTMASAGADRMIMLWNIASPEDTVPLGYTIRNSTKRPYTAALSPDGRLLASDSDENGVNLYELTPVGAPVRLGTFLPEDHTTSIRSLAFSPDQKILAAGRSDGTTLLWDVSVPGTPTYLTGSQEGEVYSVDWSPDSRILATGYGDGTVVLWDIADRKLPVQVSTLTDHSDAVISVVFSADGKRLASGSWDDTIKLWDVRDPKSPALLSSIFSNQVDAISSLAFSPDGKELAAASWDKTIVLWNVSDPTTPTQFGTPLAGHSSLIWSVAFSPDGRWLASGSSDQTVILWNVANPKTPSQIGVLPLTGVSKWVMSTDFSADGHVLASVGSTLTVWDINPESWQTRACQLAGRNLTQAEWQQYIGDLMPFQAVCPDLPVGPEVTPTTGSMP